MQLQAMPIDLLVLAGIGPAHLVGTPTREVRSETGAIRPNAVKWGPNETINYFLKDMCMFR